MGKTFIKKVEYIESTECLAEFGIESRAGKIFGIIAFILLLPFFALACWLLEFIRLINIKRVETYVEQKTKKCVKRGN